MCACYHALSVRSQTLFVLLYLLYPLLFMTLDPVLDRPQPFLYLLFFHLLTINHLSSYPESVHPLSVLIVLLLERVEVPLKRLLLGLLEPLRLLFLQLSQPFLHLLLLLLEILLSSFEVVVTVDNRVMQFL